MLFSHYLPLPIYLELSVSIHSFLNSMEFPGKLVEQKLKASSKISSKNQLFCKPVAVEKAQPSMGIFFKDSMNHA